jgi:hypothetical protein
MSLVKSYDIPAEIRKLQRFITAGWMTDTPRPEETPELPAPNA